MQIKNRQQMLVIAAAIGAAFLLGDKLVVTPLTADAALYHSRWVRLR